MRSKRKFVPMFDVSDDEDEIEIIPYVKPTPPLIEILNSTSEEEGNHQIEEKKKKKKKTRESKTSLSISTDNNDCDDNNAPSSSRSTPPKSNAGKSTENVSDKEIVRGMDNVRVGNNAELSSSTQSFGNAAIPSTLSESDISEEPLPSIRIASSIFELSEPTHDQPTEQFIPVNTGSVPAGQVKDIAAGTRKVTQSKSKARAKASPTPTSRQRISKHRIASQRTNEEILNFLTTLGIPLEPQDLEPAKPVRKSRRKTVSTDAPRQFTLDDNEVSRLKIVPDALLTAGAGEKMGNPFFPSATIVEGIDLSPLLISSELVSTSRTGSFVSVAEVCNSPFSSGKSPKKRIARLSKRTKENHGSDLEDVTFTKKDLEKVNLNMTTNVLFPSDIRLQQNSETMLEESIEVEIQNDMLVDTPTNLLTSGAEEEEKSPASKQTRVPSLSESIQKSDGDGTRTNESVTEVFDNFLKPASVTHRVHGSSKYQSESLSLCNVVKPLNKSPSENSKALEVIPFSHSSVQPESTLKQSQLTAEEMFLPYPQLSTSVSHLPSHWSQEMRQFYDCDQDPELSKSELLSCMSDDPKLWRVLHFRSKQKGSRIRCINCNQWGHVARFCPDERKKPCCRICGAKGHTADQKGSRKCPNAVCLNCGRDQDAYSSGCRRCLNSRHPVECRICLGLHDDALCPDEWRRFHSTTAAVKNSDESSETNAEPMYVSERVKYRPFRDTYCSNCSRKGHSYYNCRASHKMGIYHRNTPYIKVELPEPANLKSDEAETVTKPNLPVADRKVTMQSQSQDSDDDDAIKIIKVQIVNKPASSDSDRRNDIWKCLDFPDCKNVPSIGNSCHNMFVNESDHSILLNAQEEGKIEKIRIHQRVDITVLSDKFNVHIWGDNHVSAKEDVVRLLARLKRVKVHKSNSPSKRTTTGSVKTTEPSTSNELKQGRKERNEKSSVPKMSRFTSAEMGGTVTQQNSAGRIICEPSSSSSIDNCVAHENTGLSATGLISKNKELAVDDKASILSQIKELPAPRLNPPGQEPPEVITLDDDDDGCSKALGSLKVSLLNSEWELIFAESTKPNGLTAQLTLQFSVTIFVCKDNLTCTIQSGTMDSRKLAQQNIIYWLECAAGNVQYEMLLGKHDYSNKFEKAVNNNIKPKRPRFDPRPNAPAKRRRVGDNIESPQKNRAQNTQGGGWPRGRPPGGEGRRNDRGQFNGRGRGPGQYPDRQQNPWNNPNNSRYFHQQPDYMQYQQIAPPSPSNFPFRPNMHYNHPPPNYNRREQDFGHCLPRPEGIRSNRGASNNRLRYYNNFS